MANYVPYSDVYNPPNYGSGPIRPDRQGVRYDPTEDIEETARRQQMEAWNIPGARRAPLSDRNLQHHHRKSQSGRDRSADDAYDSRRQRRRRGDDDDDDYSDYETFSDYEESNRQRRRSRGHDENNGRRAQSEKRAPKQHYDGDVKGLVEKNFDLSPDGALFTALGAGAGAIAARRFLGNHFDPKSGSQNWKTIGGAVVGGVVANAAEKRFQKRKQEKSEQNHGY